MKLLLSGLLLVCGLSAQATQVQSSPVKSTGIEDIISIIGGVAGGQQTRDWSPGRPERGGLSCVANDAGYEEHNGGHYSCGECLREHDNCVETCTEVGNVQCEAQGYNRRGRLVSFVGEGYDQRDAQNDALDQCDYRASNCRVVRCGQARGRSTSRDCRGW